MIYRIICTFNIRGILYMVYNKLLSICFLGQSTDDLVPLFQAGKHNLSYKLLTAGDHNTGYAIVQKAGHSVGEVFQLLSN